jgi:hypothetical protein
MPTVRPLPVDKPLITVDPATTGVAPTRRGILLRTADGVIVVEPPEDADRWAVRAFWRQLDLHLAAAYSRA